MILHIDQLHAIERLAHEHGVKYMYVSQPKSSLRRTDPFAVEVHPPADGTNPISYYVVDTAGQVLPR